MKLSLLHFVNKKSCLFLAFLFFIISSKTFAQPPTCTGTAYVYYISGTNIYMLNPLLPISSSNPSLNSIALPGGCNGLAVASAIAGGTLSPTFWTTVSGIYYYYNGTAWVNTGNTTGNASAVNIGGCGSNIYNLVGMSGQVYVYNGSSNGTLLFTMPTFLGGGPYDLVIDNCCNINVLNVVGGQMQQYSPGGTLLNTWSLSGLASIGSGGGFAIIGNMVYISNGGGYQVGTISGSNISFVPGGGVLPGGPSDFASCPNLVTGAGGLSATASTNGSITCTSSSATVVATTTVSGATYSWSGPGIVGTTTLSSATATAAGTYTCIVTAGGCSAVVTTIVPSSSAVVSPTIAATGSVTCLSPTVGLSVSPTSSAYTYNWSGPGIVGSNTTPSITVNAAGNYSITVTNTVSGCTGTAAITVNAYTSAPSVTVTPITQAISCNSASANFTAMCTPTTNITGQWFDPSNAPIGSLSGSTVLLNASNPGIYTVVFVDVSSGCSTSQTVSVTAPSTVPTMTVNNLNGYTITCNQPCLAFNITASTGPAPTSYSWTNMTTTVTTTPITGGYTVCTPGNYLAAYQDGNFCRVSQLITVSIDTLRPTPLSVTNLPSNSYTLSCYNPTLMSTGYSNPLLPASNYSWTIPPNLTISSNTIGINTSSITGNPTTFTVLAKGLNGCVGKQKVLFYEDLFVPPYKAVFTPTSLSCSNINVAISPNSLSTSTIPVTFTFTSPPPTTTATAAGSLFNIPGTYTMTYQNILNGCTSSTTAIVLLNVIPPSTVALLPATIACGSTTVGLNAGLSSTSSAYTYTWFPPAGAGLSCAACYSTSTNMVGYYEVFITNTTNGCVTSNSVYVSPGSLTASITATPQDGFAPLSVNFTNGTILGAGTGTGVVTTSWSYGNGLAYTYTNVSNGGTPNGSTIYQSAGSYTVLLVVQQAIGSTTCIGTATTVITVDLPSELIIPNIFTPNGDGANDFFVVQSTNLMNMSCTIFDRWGVKMYDVTNEKGQISWDGKNLSGKEVPDGTYFYMLKATGKDDVPYEKQGTVSLYR